MSGETANADKIWTNERGNKVTTSLVGGSRYLYDFKICTTDKGFAQYDTDQDAPYFGVWINLAQRQVVTFAEGDLSITDCPTIEGFRAELKAMADFYGPPPPAFVVIDLERGQITNVYDKRPEVLP